MFMSNVNIDPVSMTPREKFMRDISANMYTIQRNAVCQHKPMTSQFVMSSLKKSKCVSARVTHLLQ